jgi:hypothetical protein
VLVTALALAVPAMGGDCAAKVLGDGMFMMEGSTLKFPVHQDTNFDSIAVGNDKAMAFGMAWGKHHPATAENNLEIKKSQDSGDCECCQALDTSCPCKDCCQKLNIEQIKVGNRNAMAFGFAKATNNIKIVTNQC